MKNAIKGLPIFLLGVILIIITDAAGSIASRKFDFDYSYLTPVSLLLYFLVGFFTTKMTNNKTGVIYAGLLGLFDSTTGWWISRMLDANIGDLKVEITTSVLVTVTLIGTVLASIIGLFCGWVANRKSKAKTTN